MRRDFYTPRIVTDEGSQRSNELAVALAQVADPEFIEAVIHLKSMLDRIGGQAYVVAFRNKYNPRTGEVITDPEAPGRHETEGYVFHYEHIARLSGQDKEPDAGDVEKIAGTPDKEGWGDEQGANPNPPVGESQSPGSVKDDGSE